MSVAAVEECNHGQGVPIPKEQCSGFKSLYHASKEVRLLEEQRESAHLTCTPMYAYVCVCVFRYYFLWNKQSFQLYEHLVDAETKTELASNPQISNGLCTLYCQCQGKPELPPFVEVVQECDEENDQFSAYNLSRLVRE